MRSTATVLLGVTIVLAAPAALADLTSLFLNRLASRAQSYAASNPNQTGYTTGIDEKLPPPPSRSSPEPLAPPSNDTVSRSQFSLGPLEGRFNSKGLKTFFDAGDAAAKVEVGYHGDLRLQFDRPTLGGNLRFSLVGDRGSSSVNLEYKLNF